MGFSYVETRNIPVNYRKWFIDRFVKEMKKASEEGSSQSRAAHDNSPMQRMLKGNHRQQVPAKLRRFT